MWQCARPAQVHLWVRRHPVSRYFLGFLALSCMRSFRFMSVCVCTATGLGERMGGHIRGACTKFHQCRDLGRSTRPLVHHPQLMCIQTEKKTGAPAKDSPPIQNVQTRVPCVVSARGSRDTSPHYSRYSISIKMIEKYGKYVHPLAIQRAHKHTRKKAPQTIRYFHRISRLITAQRASVYTFLGGRESSRTRRHDEWDPASVCVCRMYGISNEFVEE